MKTNLLLPPAMLFGLTLLTGCPHNEYIVELTPRGNVIERKVTFYRADGTNDQVFPADELAAITRFYSPGDVARTGERHSVTGRFSEVIPGDLGGAGSYINLVTSLGNAGFYMERFRGQEDLAARAERQFQAADRLTDLLIGWSRMELGREPRYPDLQRFLDADFRRDLKNLSVYWWMGEVTASYKPEAGGEFIARIAQYLVERDYVKIKDAPALFSSLQSKDDLIPARFIQRFVAGKLGIAQSSPIPASLAFLADRESIQKSLDKFLAGTDAYRAKIRQWEKERESKPDLSKPEPSAIAGDLLSEFVNFRLFSQEDHLAVKLTLPSAPIQTNGQWDETNKCVRWESKLEEGTNSVRLPAFCSAGWSNPDESFQKQHFGRVIADTDNLLEYCLWRAGLNANRANEWDHLLENLHPDQNLSAKIDAFRFSDEQRQPAPDSHGQAESPSAFARNLLKAALTEEPRNVKPEKSSAVLDTPDARKTTDRSRSR